MSYQSNSFISGMENDHNELQNSPHVHNLDYPDNVAVNSFSSACCPDYLLCSCKIFSIIVSAALFCIVLLNIVSTIATVSFEMLLTSPVRTILSFYCIFFSIVAFLCEMELTESVRSIQILQSWTLRGFFYIFVSLLTIQEAGVGNGETFIMKYGCFSSAFLAICGILYVILVIGS